MENASKALTMVAGVLIALMIIATLVYVFSEISKTKQEEDMARTVDDIAKFNSEFEAYNRKNVYGSELISVINKIEDYNIREANEEKGYTKISGEVKILIEIVRIEENKPNEVKLNEETYSIQNLVTAIKKLNNNEKTEFKRKLFKCTNVEYDNETGRVIIMNFEEIDVANS